MSLLPVVLIDCKMGAGSGKKDHSPTTIQSLFVINGELLSIQQLSLLFSQPRNSNCEAPVSKSGTVYFCSQWWQTAYWNQTIRENRNMCKNAAFVPQWDSFPTSMSPHRKIKTVTIKETTPRQPSALILFKTWWKWSTQFDHDRGTILSHNGGVHRRMSHQCMERRHKFRSKPLRWSMFNHEWVPTSECCLGFAVHIPHHQCCLHGTSVFNEGITFGCTQNYSLDSGGSESCYASWFPVKTR